VLLHGRLGNLVLQGLDIGRDVQRLDADEFVDAVLLESGEEPTHGPVIGRPRVLVADGGGEELEEAARRLRAVGGDDRRDDDAASGRNAAFVTLSVVWFDACLFAVNLRELFERLVCLPRERHDGVEKEQISQATPIVLMADDRHPTAPLLRVIVLWATRPPLPGQPLQPICMELTPLCAATRTARCGRG
jgi:hypothetical protein